MATPTRRKPPQWPVWLLALPAAVSIWAGWVELGKLTGFGVVQLLPGIWDSLRINTAVTLPIGMEAYAAYALHCWLHPATPRRARDFARVSALAALVLGGAGQVTYHLLAASGVEAAPWPVTALVACLPVAVLGLGATLAHLLGEDDEAGAATAAPARPPAAEMPPARPVASWPVVGAAYPASAVTGGAFGQPVAEPAARPAAQPTVRPAEQPTGTAPAESPSRPAEPTRQPARKPTRGKRPTRRGGQPDEQLVKAVRELAASEGRPPSQYAVRQALGVGSARAARLISELNGEVRDQ